MSISYNKLWKLLIDRNMNKSELRERAKISTNAIAKMGKNERTRVLHVLNSSQSAAVPTVPMALTSMSSGDDHLQVQYHCT